ncbi:hypothetical protein CcaverHIS002_0505970 [Cutaneotrichosporon cavernicola]|nr:hypothetical protein CcaverHIS002_0505970 [Cutaneotrichosporon cavernicola]BEJ00798.1 hypothetical protein CcaverHIS631_0506550 [Cutaneotrichosporon cavernicola]
MIVTQTHTTQFAMYPINTRKPALQPMPGIGLPSIKVARPPPFCLLAFATSDSAVSTCCNSIQFGIQLLVECTKEDRYAVVSEVITDILHPPPDPNLSLGENRLHCLLYGPAFSYLYRNGATQHDFPSSRMGWLGTPRPRRVVHSPTLSRLHLLRVGMEPDRRAWLRSLVYCLDQVGPDAPFLLNGTVDWVQADAAVANILNLIAEGYDEWCPALFALGMKQLRGLPPTGAADWAGVAGVAWREFGTARMRS